MLVCLSAFNNGGIVPGNASDGGAVNSQVLVQFIFGDNSGSHSEKCALSLTPVTTACCAMFGNNLTLKTSGTNPSGAAVPLSSCAVSENVAGKTVIKIALTRSQLKSYGLLPSNDSDCVDEMAWMDIVQTPGQSYADSEAFSALGYEFRGKATSDASQTLESTPPNSIPSESFFKAAGCEIVTAEYGGVASAKRQIMNQADYFYFSGHGDHLLNTVQGSYSPIAAAYYWGRDLDCAIIAGCSVLDVNDYNGNYGYDQHSLSPGEAWEATGPGILLGYNYRAPGDVGGAPARIMQSWLANRAAMGNVNAWMKANADNKAWNACAIVKDQKYVYFEKILRYMHIKKAINKEEW